MSKFIKTKLEVLLNKHNKKLSNFIKDTYSVKELKNKSVQIHKLLNPKPNSPKYYTENDLSNDLAEWFNKLKGAEESLISPTFFLEQQTKIDVIGALYSDAKVELYKTGTSKKILVNSSYSDCIAIINKTHFLNGSIKIFKLIKTMSDHVENNLSIVQDKKTKIIYFGYIDPISNSKYSILDVSASTGKIIGTIIKNVSLSWSSKQEMELPPNTYEFIVND